MKTDAEWAAWLDDSSARRVALYRMTANSGAGDFTRRLSNKAYGNAAAASPYQTTVSGGLKATESVNLSGQASLSAGDIENFNPNGELDSWLDDVWANKPFEVLGGDVTWAESDFRQIFNGVQAEIGSKSRKTLNIKIRDKFQRLNTPISEAKLGGSTPNKDSLIPLCFGECHNITPLLINPATLQYQVHDGAVESIFEVRDNGKVVTATVDNSTGKFTLAATPVGAVTCSVLGDKPSGVYSDTISKLVQRIVTGYGKASDRFTSGDLDATNLAAFESAHTQTVGLYVSDRMNVIDAVAHLAGSVGAQAVPSRAGLLRLIQISFPGTSTVDIPRSAQLDSSIQIVARSEVVAAVKVGYCRNYTPQPGLLTNIPAQHKDLYATDWLTATQTDSAVKAAYKLNDEPVQRNTCLMVGSEAQAEALRELNIRKVVRTTYRFEAPPTAMLYELGQTCKLFSNRFGLAAGKFGVITSLSPDWSNFHVTVEVTV